MRRQPGLRQVNGRALPGHPLGVVALVGRGADDQRHQQGRHASRAQLAHGDGAGAADHHIALGQAARHVVDEGQHLGGDAFAGIGLAHRRGLGAAALVHDLQALARRQQRQRGRQGLVEHLGAQAAAHHQQAQRAAAAGPARIRFSQSLDLGAHRVAGDDGILGLLRGDTGKAEGDAVGHRQQTLVGQQQRRIGIHQQQRLVQQRGHQPARKADIAAHAQHRVRAAAAQDLQTIPEGLEQAQAAGGRVQQALAAQAAEGDGVQRDAAPGHELVLHAVARAQPADGPAAARHLLGDGQAGDDVPTRSRGHDDEMAHARPPRMSALFWLRPARCARFTSLRDVSLRRNSAPALRAAPMLRMAVMCGLRA
ncbi:hypothetical protein RA210_U130011 [Rubrivivax sp. A210]|nr:hypothetical protein RA210_U130011 [Rubrivivax sp. A210]